MMATTSKFHPALLQEKLPETKITAEEAKLYDRQIRLWGVDAQKNLRSANVLVIGLSGTGMLSFIMGMRLNCYFSQDLK